MMKRDIKGLADDEFDAVIVGGGIYGVAIAWDATLRGLKVALIDRGDFAGKTSSNSLKTIHGGLRYLQRLDIRRMRQSVIDRRTLMIIAPHLVYPIPFVMPLSGFGSRSVGALSIALLFNDIVSYDRNRVNDPGKKIPSGRVISKEEFLSFVPDYDINKFSRGALWYDCQCFNTERLAISYVLSSVKRGALAANYVECAGLLYNNDKLIGMSARDMLSGACFDIKSEVVVNAAGPWVDQVLNRSGVSVKEKHFGHSSAMNIIVKGEIFDKCAAGLPGPLLYKGRTGKLQSDTRMLFFVPWRGHTIIGTDHRPFTGMPDEFKVRESDIESFIADINKAYPAAELKRDDVTFVHGGLLPVNMDKRCYGKVELDGKFRIYDHSSWGLNGLITIVGVKYTTHRNVAEQVTNIIFNKKGMRCPDSSSNSTLLQGSDIGRFDEFLDKAIRSEQLDSAITTHLVKNYGSDYRNILAFADNDVSLKRKVKGSSEVIRAEIINAVRNEMAVKLSDVVLRRTDLGSVEFPGDDALNEVVSIMASELGWDESRQSSEIRETVEAYKPLTG